MGTGLLCIGLTTLDVVLRPVDRLPAGEGSTRIEGVEIIPAGTAAGAAMVAATLGVKTALAGALGEDRKGRFARMILAETGIDTTLVATLAERPTSTTVLPVDSAGRRPVLHALGAGHFLKLDQRMETAARAARFVHWGGVGLPHLEGGPGAALLAAARAAGAVVTCDLISPQASAREELKRLLPHVDYFLPSAAEALGLSGASDLAGAADVYLDQGAGAVIIKNGAAGAYLALGAERITLPAHAVTAVDTTSCGDSFCAGFIAALDQGWPPLEAARFAAATAALVAQGLGTLGRLESFAATERVMRETPLREAA
jgi:sugar/nucleoside kinase (ribokinase family)